MLSQERERYRDPVRECLKGLLAIGWTVEHSEMDLPLNHRGSTRRQSKPTIVCIQKNIYMFYLRISLKNIYHNPNQTFRNSLPLLNGNQNPKKKKTIGQKFNCFVQIQRDKYFDAKTYSMIFRMREVRSIIIHILWT